MNIRIAVSSVTKIFTRGAGIRDISCSAERGEVVGIAGRNGAGKSTLVRIIAGVLSPQSGSVTMTVGDAPIERENFLEHIGLVAPYLALYDEFSPRELLAVTARLRGMVWNDSETMRALEEVRLSGLENRTIRGFSSGMMQRMRIAVARQHRPRLLLLDEPTTNLDDDGCALVNQIIDQQRAYGAVFLASNDERELEWCTKIVRIEDKLS